jgi:hypothetical protein
MNVIFKKNAIITISYTIVIVGLSFIFGEESQGKFLGHYYFSLIGIQFFITGILMIKNHLESNKYKRNGYMASFVFTWLIGLVVMLSIFFILRYEN